MTTYIPTQTYQSEANKLIAIKNYNNAYNNHLLFPDAIKANINGKYQNIKCYWQHTKQGF
jgi:hypothetical protein